MTNILKDLGYDVIKYDAGDIRNRSLIDTITSDNVSTRNVLDMMYKKETKIARSEEHTSELQSRLHLVCRLLLEKKKNKNKNKKTKKEQKTTKKLI